MKFLKYSVGDLKQPLRGKQWSDDDEKLHSFSFKMGHKENQSHLILLGPFNVENEMDICKQGFMLHAIPDTGQDIVEEVDLDKPLLQDIFVQAEYFEPHFPLDTVINKDMREIVQPAFKNVIGEERFKNLPKDSMDFAAARLLPTDLYLELERRGENSSHVMAKTREFLSRQFNEVRLLDDITKANLEQIQAIDMYRHSKSSAINISGRPGVGKSTILHIDACEALLQRGELRGERKLLYLAATAELIEEAKSEILDLLKHLYFWNSKNPEEDAKNIFKNIDFAVEEDFFLREPGSLGPLTDFELFKQQVEKTEDDPSWNFWKKETNLRYLQRILQNFVYGVFGSPSDFCNWIPKGPIEKLEERFTRPFNFYNPERRFNPDESDELSSDFFATYFWDPGFNDKQIGGKEAAKRINGLANFISKGGLGDYLVDYSINKYTGMYDVGSVVHKTANKLFVDKKSFLHHEAVQENRLWSQILERGYDVILVDESQDFSALSISTMLRYFSNRGAHRDSNHAPFSFVCAGDEFQTIHGTLFQGAMIHINKIYTDWKMLLREQSADDFQLLSDNLPNPIKLVLRASYRTSDLQTEILDNNIKMMREIALKAGHRRSVSISTYGIRRNGVIAGLPKAGSPENENLANWAQVMQDLLSQIKHIDEPDAAPKVAFIFPITELKSFDQIMKQLEDFRKMDLHKDIIDIIEEMDLEIKKQYEKIKHKYSSSESLVDLNFISMIKEAGFCDIRSIKGLTVPVAVTLMPPVKLVKNARWFENMRNLSLSLVMISRSQFGLFIAAPEEIVELTIGDQLWSKVSNGDVTKGLMHSSLPPGDNFADRLANSSPSEISPKLLFKIAINEWYIERGWNRLHGSALLDNWQREVVDKLRKIYIGVRANGILAYDEVEDLGDFREKAESAENIFGTFDYFSEEAVYQLQWFLLWQDLCKKSSEGASKSVKKGLIKRIQMFYNEMWFTVVDGDSFSRDMISSLVTKDVATRIKQFDHPWNKELTNISKLHTQELDIVPPRFHTGPWKLTAPPNIPVEEKIFWHQNSNYWAPPANVLREVLKESVSEHAALMNWAIDWIEQDVEVLMKSALSSFEQGDISYLAWVLRLVYSDEEDSPNQGQYLHGEILNYLTQEIPKNKLLCEGLTAWLEQTGSTENIENGCTFIQSLYGGREKSARRERNRVLTEYLDGLRIFKSWLRYAKGKKKSAFDIPNVILKLTKGRLGDVLTKLQKLNSFHGRRGKKDEFLKSAFSIKINTIQEIESQNKIKGGALKSLIERVYQDVLTDDTPKDQVTTLGYERQGWMYNDGLLKDVHYDQDIGWIDDEDRLLTKGVLKKSVNKKENFCEGGRGGHATRYYKETDTFECSKCSSPILMDEGYLWYKSMVEVMKNSNYSVYGFLYNLVIDQLKDSYDTNMERITKETRQGRIPYSHLTESSKKALCLELAAAIPTTSSWREGGHLGNWVDYQAAKSKDGIGEITTKRFDSSQSLFMIGNNGDTDNAYHIFHHHLFVGGFKNVLMQSASSFANGGAVAEAQALFIAGFPHGKSDGEFLQHFSQSLHIEGLTYQEHVSGQKRHNPILPEDGEYEFHKSIKELYGDMRILPNRIYSEYGGANWGREKLYEFFGEEPKASEEANFQSLYEEWILPYIQRMGTYVAMSKGAKLLEEIGREQEKIGLQSLKTHLESGLSKLETPCFSKEAFKSMRKLSQLGGSNKYKSLTDIDAFDWSGLTAKIERNISVELDKKCDLFLRLLKIYKLYSAQASESETTFDWHEDDLEQKRIRLDWMYATFGILQMYGLQQTIDFDDPNPLGSISDHQVAVDSIDYSDFEWGKRIAEPVATELIEGFIQNSKKLLEHHLREKYGLTDKMITMFLGEVGRGKPELDRMLDKSNEQVWGAYQALLNHSNEEE